MTIRGNDWIINLLEGDDGWVEGGKKAIQTGYSPVKTVKIRNVFSNKQLLITAWANQTTAMIEKLYLDSVSV